MSSPEFSTRKASPPTHIRTRLYASVSLSLASILTLVGCSSSAKTGAGTATASGSTTTRSAAAAGSPAQSSAELRGTITVSTLTLTAKTTALQDAIDGFKKLQPGVTVKMVQEPSDAYHTTIREQLAANHGPDVMFVWPGAGDPMSIGPLAQAGDLADLSNESWASAISGPQKDMFSTDGKLYALDTYLLPFAVNYNSGLLKTLGVSVPTTFSDLLRFCTSLSSKGITPIALGNQTAYLNTEIPLQLSLSLMYAQDKNFPEKESQPGFWTSKLWTTSLTKALNQYVQMKDAGCFEDNSTGYSLTAATNLVATKKAFGLDGFSEQMTPLKQGNPSLSYGFFEIPATDNPSDTVLDANPGSAYAVNEHSHNKAAAIAFLDYMAAPAQQAEAAQAAFGIPYDAASGLLPELQGVKDLVTSGHVVFSPTNYWPNASVKTTMEAQDEALILKKKSVAQVAAAIQASITSGN